MLKRLLFVMLIALGAWHWYARPLPGFTGQEHDRLIMYSLTTCGYCDQKRRDLIAARIPFTEHFIDKDPGRQDEFARKLEKAGIPPQAVGTPSFDARGYMLINNPSLEKIREYLEAGQRRS
jgi:glutaredoxin